MRNNMIVIQNCHQQNNQICIVSLWVKIGSIFEYEDTAGYSHLIEHLIFRRASELGLLDNLLDNSIHYSASVNKEYTFFKFIGPNDCFEIIQKFINDAIFEVEYFSENWIQEEIKIIENEITLNNSSFNKVKSLISNHIFETNLRFDIYGNIDKFLNKSEKIYAFYSRFYKKNNYFQIMFENNKIMLNCNSFFHNYNHKEAIKKNKDMKQGKIITSHLSPIVAIAFPACSIYDVNKKNYDVLSKMIGGIGIHSILLKELREKRSLVYAANASNLHYSKEGVFCVFCTAKNEDKIKILNIIISTLEKSIKKGLSKEDFNKLVLSLKIENELHSLDIEKRIKDIGNNILYFGYPSSINFFKSTVELDYNEFTKFVQEFDFNNYLAII